LIKGGPPKKLNASENFCNLLGTAHSLFKKKKFFRMLEFAPLWRPPGDKLIVDTPILACFAGCQTPFLSAESLCYKVLDVVGYCRLPTAVWLVTLVSGTAGVPVAPGL
jgi:hypothetical protein